MNKIKDGDRYRTFEIEGVMFDIYYGYSTASERQHGWEPSPIYPDFTKKPQYTPAGQPFVTAYQDACAHYSPVKNISDDHWCYNCEMFDKREQYIGICQCKCRCKQPENGV